jgi:hypothetical protein
MSIKDPIKEIIDEFDDRISLYKKEREDALDNFKKVINVKKIEDVKSSLKSDVQTDTKK